MLDWGQGYFQLLCASIYKQEALYNLKGAGGDLLSSRCYWGAHFNKGNKQWPKRNLLTAIKKQFGERNKKSKSNPPLTATFPHKQTKQLMSSI